MFPYFFDLGFWDLGCSFSGLRILELNGLRAQNLKMLQFDAAWCYTAFGRLNKEPFVDGSGEFFNPASFKPRMPS